MRLPKGFSSCGAAFRPGQVEELAVSRIDDPDLRGQFERQGYLYIPGFHDRTRCEAARSAVLAELRAEGSLLQDDFVAAECEMAFRPELADAVEVQSLVYAESVMAFFDRFFGEPARHYDYTWLRAVSPGKATRPHYDVVYMGRGTLNVCTMWTPLSDVTFDLGGLAILEGSHRLEDLKSTYGQLDVDVACANLPGVAEWEHRGYSAFGGLSEDPPELAERFGLVWKTAEFQMGDALIFGMHTLHCSTDNKTGRIRLSTDTRYQPASQPIDERWVGEHPMGHGGKALREAIC